MTIKSTHTTFKCTLLAGIISQALIPTYANSQERTSEQQVETEEKIVVTGRRVTQTDIAIGT
ncbi:MAG: hypothetical protein SWL02_12730, partial [Pseudomonadota bacterium]|nr:hypothetical protein [Pseudomonadota bacterium]